MSHDPMRNEKGKEIDRRMKSHKKSRKGCGNCKFRKVKCDEIKPACRRCEVYGTFCNYDSRYTELQPLAQSQAHGRNIVQIQTLHLDIPPCSQNRTILAMIDNAADTQSSNPSYTFHMQDLETLTRFTTRTIFTLGEWGSNAMYRDAYAKLMYSHPFLMHMVLALTLSHDLHLNLNGSPRTLNSIEQSIVFHQSLGASLLNSKLTSGLLPPERDAAWACGGALGILTFCSMKATTSEEAWPLSRNTETDLDWLKISEGKKSIIKIVDPFRKDSVFYPMMSEFLQYAMPSLSESIEALKNLPQEIVLLCGLNDASTAHNNAYFSTASFLGRVVDIECTLKNIRFFLGFFTCMHSDLKKFMQSRDPAALLLLAIWYRKIVGSQQWWIRQRAVLEHQAICKYLESYYGDNDSVLNALKCRQVGHLEIISGV